MPRKVAIRQLLLPIGLHRVRTRDGCLEKFEHSSAGIGLVGQREEFSISLYFRAFREGLCRRYLLKLKTTEHSRRSRYHRRKQAGLRTRRHPRDSANVHRENAYAVEKIRGLARQVRKRPSRAGSRRSLLVGDGLSRRFGSLISSAKYTEFPDAAADGIVIKMRRDGFHCHSSNTIA